jgi:hypothetical protein
VPKLDKLSLSALCATDRVNVSVSSILTVVHYCPRGVNLTRELLMAARTFTQSSLKLQQFLLLSDAEHKQLMQWNNKKIWAKNTLIHPV